MYYDSSHPEITEHNNSIDSFISEELPKFIDINDGKITATDWFKAQRLIGAQEFYKRGKKILDELRARGFDIKMDMQSNKLVDYGSIE